MDNAMGVQQWRPQTMTMTATTRPLSADAAASRNHPAPTPPKNRRSAAEPAEIIGRRRRRHNFHGTP